MPHKKRLSKEKRAELRQEAMQYVEARKADLLYYLARTDLTMKQISESTNIGFRWITSVRYGQIKKPNDRRITVIIDFVKDFERLQTYYIALAK